jgi:hypothetical protein
VSATFGFSVERLACVEPEVTPNYGTRSIYIEAGMTDEQMFAALQGFIAHVSPKTWAEWLARIAGDAS